MINDDSQCQSVDRCFQKILNKQNLLLLISAIIFCILAALVSAAGIYLLDGLDDFSSLASFPLVIVSTVLSFVLICATLLPWFSIRYQRPRLAKLFLIIVSVCLLLQFVLCGALLTTHHERQHHMNKNWHQLSSEQRAYFQFTYTCCGWNSPTDYPAISAQCSNVTELPTVTPGCEAQIMSIVNYQLEFFQLLLLSVTILQTLFLVFWFFLLLCINERIISSSSSTHHQDNNNYHILQSDDYL